MPASIVFALPLGLVWMGITSQFSLASFAVGTVLGFFVMRLTEPAHQRFDPRRLGGQALALLLYVLWLFRDMLFSGVDVARRVLSPRMPLDIGIVAVETQDPTKNQTITALSALVITLTPGELVVEIDEDQVMYVHSLDAANTAKHAGEVQARRLRLLKRVLGEDPS